MSAEKKAATGIDSPLFAASEEYCGGCIYQGNSGVDRTCDYILHTGRRRPCPGGAGCTVKETIEDMRDPKWDVARAREMYQRGIGPKAIAERLGVNAGTLKSYISTHKWTRGPAPEAAEVQAEARAEDRPEPVTGDRAPEPQALRAPEPAEGREGRPVVVDLRQGGEAVALTAPDLESARRLFRWLGLCLAGLETEDDDGTGK